MRFHKPGRSKYGSMPGNGVGIRFSPVAKSLLRLGRLLDGHDLSYQAHFEISVAGASLCPSGQDRDADLRNFSLCLG